MDIIIYNKLTKKNNSLLVAKKNGLLTNSDNFIIYNNFCINKITGRIQTFQNAQKDLNKEKFTINDYIYNKTNLLYNEITNRFVLNTKENINKLNKLRNNYKPKPNEIKEEMDVINNIIKLEKNEEIKENDEIIEENKEDNEEIKISTLNNNYNNGIGVYNKFMINKTIKDIDLYLSKLKDPVNEFISNKLERLSSIRLYYVLEVILEKNKYNSEEIEDNNENEKITMKFYFYAIHRNIFNINDMTDYYDSLNDIFKKKLEDRTSKNGSGWVLKNIEGLVVNIVKYKVMSGSSYIELPLEIRLKKCIINPVNKDDNKCFKYAFLIAKYNNKVKNNKNLVYNYNDFEKNHDFSMLDYPTSIHKITEFEFKNNVAINVWKNNKDNDEIDLLYAHKNAVDEIYDLLLIKNEENSHYTAITRLNALFRVNKHTRYCCNRCFCRFSTEDIYNKHIEEKSCKIYIDEAIKVLPDPEKAFVEFKKYKARVIAPVAIYADKEARLIKIKNENNDINTKEYQFHSSKHFGLKLVSRYPELITDNYIQFDGDNATEDGLKYLFKMEKKIIKIIKETNYDIDMTEEDKINHEKASSCWICLQKLNNDKVADHDHLKPNNNYRGAAHNSCNLKLNNKGYKIPVIFHNLKGYDSHLLLQEAGKFKKKFKVIPLNKEKYIGFDISNLRFLDSLAYTGASLEKLVEGLLSSKDNSLFKNFNEEFTNISNELNILLKQKGIFPYDWYDSEDKLYQQLPAKSEFYSLLNKQECSEENYNRAKKVYQLSKCKNFKDYLDLYLKTDVILLADCMENFRNICYKFYGLELLNYYTAPGFSWDAMLFGYFRTNIITIPLNNKNETWNKLEYYKDIDYIYDKTYKLRIDTFNCFQKDMLEFIKGSIRGGISVISHRYATANNPYIKETYDPTKENNYIIYLDCNNLYGYAMSEYLPLSNYKWNKKITLKELLKVNDNSDKGYIVSVNIKYPEHLHDKFSDYAPGVNNTSFHDSPFMSNIANELNINSDNKVNKLIPNLYNKINYICHYRILKQFKQLGIEIMKVNKVLEFKQEPFIKDFIMFNTMKRAETKLDYEKELFKLLNNSIYGKTVENVEKRVDVKLVSDSKKFIKLVSKPNFNSFTIFNNNLCAVQLNKKRVKYDKPIPVGYSVLEISKYKMYDFHYNVIKKQYPDNKSKLLFTDTDSLCYNIYTEDLYNDMKENSKYYDFSEYPEKHVLYNQKNKKIAGYFKDETHGKLIKEFIGIKPKNYIIKVHEEDELKIRLKGIKKKETEKLTLTEFKDVLLIDNEDRTKMVKNMNYNMFKTNNHLVKTVNITKQALTSYDNKRYYLNMIDSLPFGHYKTYNN